MGTFSIEYEGILRSFKLNLVCSYSTDGKTAAGKTHKNSVGARDSK